VTNAPFPPLVAGAEGLDESAEYPISLQVRMAEVYGVPVQNVLPVAGRAEAAELLVRRAFARGERVVSGPAAFRTIARIYGLSYQAEPKGADLLLALSPGSDGEAALDMAAAKAVRENGANGLLIADETAIEFSDSPSLASEAAKSDWLLVIRSLSQAYGLLGAPCAALIGGRDLIQELGRLQTQYLPTPVVNLALSALSPSRMLATQARIAQVKDERARMVAMLDGRAQATQAPWVILPSIDLDTADEKLRPYRVAQVWRSGEGIRIGVSADAAVNDRALAALGVAVTSREPRRGEAVRDTKETKIAVTVDLDTGPSAKVSTGVGYFDHMLEQVAIHGGFSLTLGCEGDTHIDTHHTIEDCALAFGTALKQALGSKRGIARFGFVLPMDETEAKVSVDLGGRPFAVFEGSFAASHLGEYPTEMTAHVFRSLAESLGAAIHVEVKGENDHHKTEACFKAFGRALRQAVRIEGSDMPSTKGVI
jgi:imidazoleglycerol-phosphate dehydratase/histidinol-phosphatase